MWIFVWFGLDGGHETCVVFLASPPGNMKTERILAISGHIKLSVEGARSWWWENIIRCFMILWRVWTINFGRGIHSTAAACSICWHIELFKTASWTLSTVMQWRLRIIGIVSYAFLFRLAGANYESCQPTNIQTECKGLGLSIHIHGLLLGIFSLLMGCYFSSH